MLRVTPKVVINNAEHVDLLEGFKRFTNKQGIHRVTAKVRTNTSFDGQRHKIRKVIVENRTPNKTVLSAEHVRVYCTCEFFKWYGCADVLFKRDAGFKQFATGIMPDIHNPNYTPFVCKHLVEVLQRIVEEKL